MNKQKKILVLTTTDNMIWQFVVPHMQELQKMGHIVECACAKTGFWFDELRDKFGFVVHEIKFGRKPWNKENFVVFKGLKELQKREKYDLIFCHQPVGGVFARMLGHKFHLPVIYVVHGFHFFKGNNKIKNFIFKTIEKHYSRYTDALVTINEEDFAAAKKLKAKKVYKIDGIGFDLKKYFSTNKTKAEVKKELGLNDEFVVLVVAEFIKRKNYETILKTINELKNENIKLLVCGLGKDENRIKQIINEYGIEKNVELLGYRKDINDIMTASDVFFLPSHQEGLTLSIIEALSLGLPVLTSDVRGNRDLIADGVNGFVCNQNDFKAFAEKLMVLKNNKNLREKMSKENKIYAKKYDIDVVKKQLSEVYKQFDL